MSEPAWILSEVAIAVHSMLLAEHGGLHGLRDPAALESALARARQRHAYDSAASLFELAAAYGYGIARSHPFVDGNKRVALAITAVFLEVNGYSLDATEPEAVVIIQQLASGRLGESAYAAWLESMSVSAVENG